MAFKFLEKTEFNGTTLSVQALSIGLWYLFSRMPGIYTTANKKTVE